jgi:hypothetical protein
MATLTPISKNTASLTGQIRHGKDTVLSEIQNFTFTTVMFPDGTQLKDVTFAQLSDTVWTLVTKNNATLTAPTKN